MMVKSEHQAQAGNATPPEGTLDQAPPKLDPYFVKKDGTPVTGTPADKEAKPAPKDAEPPEPPAAAKSAEKKPEPKPAEAKPPEKPKAEEPAKSEDEEKLTEAWIKLKKQRKALAEDQRQMQRELSEARALKAELEELKALREKDPYEFATKRMGLSFRELAERATKEDAVDPAAREAQALKAELENVKQRLAKFEEREQTIAQQSAYDADVSTVHGLITESDYPLLHAYGADRLSPAIVQHWHSKGGAENIYDILDAQEAAIRDDLERLAPARVRDDSGRFAPRKPAEPAEADSPARKNGAVQSAKTGARDEAPSTITNRVGSERASSERPLTKAEKFARSAALLKFHG